MLDETKINKIKLIINISLNILMIAIFLSIIIKYYIGFSEYEYIWFCSKILTLKKMIKNNNKKDKVLSHYYNSVKYSFNGKYLDFLKTISKGECISGYRKCGIIDTYGNPFCVPQDINCPVNEMIVDSVSRLSYYQGNYYSYYTTDNSQLYLYYKRGIINNGIIVQKVIEESQPLYINEDNFVFDFDALEIQIMIIKMTMMMTMMMIMMTMIMVIVVAIIIIMKRLMKFRKQLLKEVLNLLEVLLKIVLN